MDSKEFDIENLNEIDTHIDSRYLDDDSDSFGSIKITNTKDTSDLEFDDRNFSKNTGIIIDLSDDDDIVSTKKISANLNSENGIDIQSDFDMLMEHLSEMEM